MSVTIVVQSRMGSTRLPGKVLRTLGGRPMLELMLRRAQRAECGPVVVATSELERDDPIAALAHELDVSCVRGSESDVLGRFALAAHLHPADHIVRLTADCPLADPNLIDEVVATHIVSGADYTSNTLLRTYPDGLDVEVMRTSALADAASRATCASEREHVTPYLYRHPADFRLGAHIGLRDLEDERWTVDTAEDFDFVESVLAVLGVDPVLAPWTDVLDAIGIRHKSASGTPVLRVARDLEELEVVLRGCPEQLGTGHFVVGDPGARTWTVRCGAIGVGVVAVNARQGEGHLTARWQPSMSLCALLQALELRLHADVQVTRLVVDPPIETALQTMLRHAGFDEGGDFLLTRIEENPSD